MVLRLWVDGCALSLTDIGWSVPRALRYEARVTCPRRGRRWSFDVAVVVLERVVISGIDEKARQTWRRGIIKVLIELGVVTSFLCHRYGRVARVAVSSCRHVVDTV